MKIKKIDEINSEKEKDFDNKVCFLWMDDLNVIYVDGKLIYEDDGVDALYLLKLAEKYNFVYSDLYVEYAYEPEDEEYWIKMNNSFPRNIEDLPMYDRWLKKTHPDRYEAKKFNL